MKQKKTVATLPALQCISDTSKSKLLQQAHKAQHEFDLHKLQSAVSETNLSTELAELRKNYARMEELHKMEVRVVRGHGKEWVIDDCFSIPFHTICSRD